MIQRGDIYYIDLNPVKGREQAGRRSALVVSSDAINRQPLVVSVVVGTDSANVKKDYSVNVRASAAQTGLSKETVFLCFQLRAIDPSRLIGGSESQPVGRMPAAKMREVDAALRRVLEL